MTTQPTIPLDERYIEEVLSKAGLVFDRFQPSSKLRIALNKIVLTAYADGAEDAALHELERNLTAVANKAAADKKAPVVEDRITLDTDTHIYFYEQDHYYLSNFSSFNLIWNDIKFPTVEHAYQWSKFVHPMSAMDLIERRQTSALIVSASSAHDAYKIAVANKHLVRQDYWESVKVLTMKNLLIAKVQRHEYVRRKLAETGTKELVENSWRDDFWGTGPTRKGKNVLGKCWMEIRDMLNAGTL
jgi:hypothetical protein